MVNSTNKVRTAFTTWTDLASVKRHRYNNADENSVEGKIIVITGANSGIGKATALEMAKRGAIVVIACPRTERKLSELAMEEIVKKSNNSQVEIVDLDLGDLASVRKCAQTIRDRHPHINILINNAGILYEGKTRKVTKDGFEIHMGINYLGHVLFTMLLLDLVKKGAPSRIVSTSSMLFQSAELDLDDLMLEKRGVFGMENFGPYGNSKLALMYFMSALSKELRGTGVTTYSLCPGFCLCTRMSNNMYRKKGVVGFLKAFRFLPAAPFLTGPKKGAETILHCALSKTRGKESGQMHRYNNTWPEAQKILNADPEKEQKLWDMSLRLVGLAK